VEKDSKKIVLFGDGPFAEIAYEYFTHDSPWEVAAFSLDREYIKRNTLFGLPVVPFDEIETRFPPSRYKAYTAFTYNSLNRLRTRFYMEAKKKGYTFVNYVSSRAFVWPNVSMGENNFIFENNVVQPFVKLGNNIVLWSGNHIGHHSTIDDNCFIASHVVISGFCHIGNSSFLGVNCTIINNITVGRDNLIGAGVTIAHNTENDKIYGAETAQAKKRPAKAYFKVSE
jgi:sugar O-acyltransferase (sialic acid O-acetyltransferase NeuD family)